MPTPFLACPKMKQLSKHQVNKLTVKELEAKLPFQIVADGKVFAVVLPAKEFSKPQLPETKGKLQELPLSKKRQVEHQVPKTYWNKPE